MECLTTSFAREHSLIRPSEALCEKQCFRRRVLCYFPASRNSSQCRKFTSMAYPVSPIVGRRSNWRLFAASLNLEEGSSPLDSTSSSSEQASDGSEVVHGDSSENILSRKLKSDELLIKDDAVVKFKSELAVLELELHALIGLAEEIANFDVPSGSRKINGKYIQSHLLSRLEAVHDKVMEQIKDVDSLKPQEIYVYWVGMAENVQIMGSFDGWSQGETMSMEYLGAYARFSATLKLRPGRYEIKFLVDGEWKLSPEYPIAGEGLAQNNILLVDQ
ncbi:hypothetical protein GUJ93_ZPchr0006g43880 [Zizania palustris]|uniref:AMP-activated protein kinase glycogen-binding domain-containing protein n=1 Tax=Zizania palustris TaxID=103762 RepID=A0A8J5SRF7_ZIZPA|nr:hypothetical protein GUJ93_ZPchr0006g43880 [Zizania palustris]